MIRLDRSCWTADFAGRETQRISNARVNESCVETIRHIMATTVAPQPIDADNIAGLSPKRPSGVQFVTTIGTGLADSISARATTYKAHFRCRISDCKRFLFAINFEFILILGGSPYAQR
jgi:hypothetical protein